MLENCELLYELNRKNIIEKRRELVPCRARSTEVSPVAHDVSAEEIDGSETNVFDANESLFFGVHEVSDNEHRCCRGKEYKAVNETHASLSPRPFLAVEYSSEQPEDEIDDKKDEHTSHEILDGTQ